LYIANRP